MPLLVPSVPTQRWNCPGRATHSCGLKMRLILVACSPSHSSSSTPSSTLNFLLLGLMGWGPVRWLLRAEVTGNVCILESPRRAASPGHRETEKGDISQSAARTGRWVTQPQQGPPPARPLAPCKETVPSGKFVAAQRAGYTRCQGCPLPSMRHFT